MLRSSKETRAQKVVLKRIRTVDFHSKAIDLGKAFLDRLIKVREKVLIPKFEKEGSCEMVILSPAKNKTYHVEFISLKGHKHRAIIHGTELVLPQKDKRRNKRVMKQKSQEEKKAS